jgi:hypothetical protein
VAALVAEGREVSVSEPDPILVRIPRRLETASSLAANGDIYDVVREIRSIGRDVEHVAWAVRVVRQKLLAAEMAQGIAAARVADRLIQEAYDLLTEISVPLSHQKGPAARERPGP